MTAATCGWVTMSMRELDRLKVIEAIIEGRLKPAAAAQRLRLTTRQVHRLVLRYREDGPAGLTSRRRGQPSNRQLSPGLENPAISLIRRNYSDFGPTLAQEKLVECHGLKLAKETVRRIMVDAGMWVPRKQRPPKVYQPRNRRACCGELIQIDDGKPLAFYSDKASVFRSNHKAPQGGDGYTQFGRAMYELNIESICANSSQAKGRVERANLTLQDRLVKELRLRGISNMPDANAFAAHFMASYNARFAKPPRSEHDCHRPLHSDEVRSPIAWAPVSRVPHGDGETGHFPHIIERGKPGLIGVLANGRRFVNEAHGYHDYVAALLEATPPGQPARSWLVCDRRFLRRYGLGYVRPAPLPIAAHLRSGYLKRGTSLDQLARSCGIDPSGLAATVAEYNRHAREGRDPEFGRGGTAFNRKQGDPAYPGPNPCVAPIERGPYYAVQVEPGCFGTFAGLKTDAQARVLDGGGQPIPGLYAAGADMASLFAGHYPSGGINLGPALTFGYIAGRHIAGALGYEQEQAQRG